MNQNRLDEIIRALTSKNVTQPCPRCANKSFTVVGESYISIQDDPNTLSVGGPSVPTAIVACDNCGYVTQHALGSLGLLSGGK